MNIRQHMWCWVAMCMMAVACGQPAANAQITIPGTKVTFTFPSKWAYLNTEKVDDNTSVYLYGYAAETVSHDGDTTLPLLRIVVSKNYNGSVFDYVFSRYSKEPYQALNDYTQGLGLPKSGGMGYIGAYTNLKDGKDYQFRMVYFKVQNTIIEFKLETTTDTFGMMEKEFASILESLKTNE